MLERFTDDHRARRRRRIRPTALLSIAAHVAALFALLAAATWRVDKLETAETPVLLAAGIGLPLPETASPEPAAKKPRPPRTRKDLSQPGPASDDADTPEGEPGSNEDPGPHTGLRSGCPPGARCESILDNVTAPVCGDGRMEGDEQCDDGGRADGDGCSASCRREREAMVAPNLVEGHRIAGDPQIPAPESVRRQMAQDRESRAVGTVKMCLDRDGTVRSLRVLRSTGYSQYDDLLTSRMQSWRYRPYQLSDGTAVPICTAVTFVYLLRP